jgi:hypothetical protein
MEKGRLLKFATKWENHAKKESNKEQTKKLGHFASY